MGSVKPPVDEDQVRALITHGVKAILPTGADGASIERTVMQIIARKHEVQVAYFGIIAIGAVSIALLGLGRLIDAPWAPVRLPPGHRLLAIAEFLYSRKTYEQVFMPAVTDLRIEHADALAGGRKRKARWIHVRGVAGVLLAAAGLTLGGVIRFVAKAYRGVTG